MYEKFLSTGKNLQEIYSHTVGQQNTLSCCRRTLIAPNQLMVNWQIRVDGQFVQGG